MESRIAAAGWFRGSLATLKRCDGMDVPNHLDEDERADGIKRRHDSGPPRRPKSKRARSQGHKKTPTKSGIRQRRNKRY